MGAKGDADMTILAIDQGTTSTRSILFDEALTPGASRQEEFAQHFPRSGWVEHEAADLIDTVRRTAAVAEGATVAAIGITNQRETTVIWDRRTGKAVHRAIVWQDRRTAERCRALKAEGHEALVTERTGLLLDPYFSSTKAAWILDEVEGARQAAEEGHLLFGTVDSFLIWHLTGGVDGGRHVTDATNAARTMLYDIHEGQWDEDICRLLGVPMGMLPEVLDCADEFGTTDLLGAPVPILGVAGDQQAATVGQACFRPGMLKSTYGTGCFALLNVGETAVTSTNRLLGTIAFIPASHAAPFAVVSSAAGRSTGAPSTSDRNCIAQSDPLIPPSTRSTASPRSGTSARIAS